MVKQTRREKIDSRFRVNEEINVNGNVRIVGEGIESKVVGIMEARKMADAMDMDLVLLNDSQQIPIIRICNYEKMLYEIKKNEKKNKHNSKPLKEIQLTVNIARHDLETKANNARKFLEDGSRVKVVLSMKGRELTRRDENKRSILEFIVMLEDIAVPESVPRDEGNRTIVILKKKKQ
jgi:translation initiation factor IF-3